MNIRKTNIDDVAAIYEMYCAVAKIPGGLARLCNEISLQYVNNFVEKSLESGVSFVAEEYSGKIVGEIHAYSSRLFCFSHVLTELTVAVDPNFQNQSIGRRLFENLFKEIERNHPEIHRVELISRESNQIAIQFYESLGFVKEGRFERRIRNIDGSLEADIPMSWTKYAL